MSEQDPRPFPIKPYRADNGVALPPGFIPRYWAVFIHKLMCRHYGDVPPLDRIAEQGGFNPATALDLLAGGVGDGRAFRALVANEVRSIKGDVPVIVPGTKEYGDAMRELEDEQKERERQQGKLTYGYGLSRTTR